MPMKTNGYFRFSMILQEPRDVLSWVVAMCCWTSSWTARIGPASLGRRPCPQRTLLALLAMAVIGCWSVLLADGYCFFGWKRGPFYLHSLFGQADLTYLVVHFFPGWLQGGSLGLAGFEASGTMTPNWWTQEWAAPCTNCKKSHELPCGFLQSSPPPGLFRRCADTACVGKFSRSRRMSHIGTEWTSPASGKILSTSQPILQVVSIFFASGHAVPGVCMWDRLIGL